MDLRKKLLVLSVSAMAFAGVSYGQTACGAPGTPYPAPVLVGGAANLLRIEGTNELATDLLVTCPAGATLPSGSVIITLNANATSKALAAPAVGTEATLRISAPAAQYQGVVSGNTITFSGVSFPAAAYTMQISNVRVNASSLAVATYVTESLLVTNGGVVAYAGGPASVGYVQQGFTVPSLTKLLPPATNPTNYVICTANPTATATTSFQITVKEAFGGAFKTQVPTAATTGGGLQCGAGACSLTNGEQGSFVSGAVIGTATSGTRFQLSFAGIPTGVTVYLPTTVTTANPNLVAFPGASPTTFTLVTSATAAYTPLTTPTAPVGSAATLAGYVGLAAANGAATAVYEVTSTDNTVPNESVNIIGIATASPNFSATSQPAMTVTVTPAPTGTPANVPNFAASANTAITLSAFNVCQTNLLFPYVTSQFGFDTGIVLANTSTDPFLVGATATPQTGTCTLNFYGTGAPTPATGVAAPGGTQASGTDNAFLLSSLAPGFTGYVIAQCNYLYGHGYAFLEYNLTQNNGIAEGYIAEVLTGRPVAGAAADGVTF